MSACTDEDMLGQSGDSVNITFRPSLGGELNTRAIGDATGIDQLVVAVYEGNGTLSKHSLIRRIGTLFSKMV